MTTEQLNRVINILATITLFEMMVAIGLGVAVRDVLRVAGTWSLVGKALLASYVIVPAAAIGLLILLHAHPEVAAGFLIVAVCPGAPYGPPFTKLAHGNVVTSVGLMVILAASSALAAPLLLHFLLPFVLQRLQESPGEQALTVDAVKIVTTLLVAQFLPLCLGLALRYARPALAERWQKPANRLSTILNLVLLSLVIYAQFDMLLDVPMRGYAGMLALVLASAAAGWLLSGPSERSAMVMATAVRNVGVSLVIVTAAFAGTRAVAATTVFAIFQTLVMAMIAVGWGKLANASS
jgi:bile acid:Na+ symporter, BASS family